MPVIVIKCFGEYAFGGRTTDTFVVDDFSSLDELQPYIENMQPIKCKEPTSYFKDGIINKRYLADRLVYLNNYLKIKKVNDAVMDDAEKEELYKNACKKCKFHDGSLSSVLQCSYTDDGEGGCDNLQEYFSFNKWFKNKYGK
jgi:hypothetical protein